MSHAFIAGNTLSGIFCLAGCAAASFLFHLSLSWLALNEHFPVGNGTAQRAVDRKQ